MCSHENRLNEAILMDTHTIPFYSFKKKNYTKLSQICSQEIFSKGLKNEFEIAVVNDLSVFEPLKLRWSWVNFQCRGVLQFG